MSSRIPNTTQAYTDVIRPQTPGGKQLTFGQELGLVLAASMKDFDAIAPGAVKLWVRGVGDKHQVCVELTPGLSAAQYRAIEAQARDTGKMVAEKRGKLAASYEALLGGDGSLDNFLSIMRITRDLAARNARDADTLARDAKATAAKPEAPKPTEPHLALKR